MYLENFDEDLFGDDSVEFYLNYEWEGYTFFKSENYIWIADIRSSISRFKAVDKNNLDDVVFGYIIDNEKMSYIEFESNLTSTVLNYSKNTKNLIKKNDIENYVFKLVRKLKS